VKTGRLPHGVRCMKLGRTRLRKESKWRHVKWAVRLPRLDSGCQVVMQSQVGDFLQFGGLFIMALRMLERSAGKLASCVLRRGGSSNAILLSDFVFNSNPDSTRFCKNTRAKYLILFIINNPLSVIASAWRPVRVWGARQSMYFLPLSSYFL